MWQWSGVARPRPGPWSVPTLSWPSPHCSPASEPQVDTELREVEVIILTCHRAPLGTRPTVVRTFEPLLCSGSRFCYRRVLESETNSVLTNCPVTHCKTQITAWRMADIYAFINSAQVKPSRSCEYCPLSSSLSWLDLVGRVLEILMMRVMATKASVPIHCLFLLSHLGLSCSTSCKIQSQAFLAC